MGASGYQSNAPLPLSRAVGIVSTVSLDLRECSVQIGPATVDHVTWYGEPPTEGALVTLTQSGTRMIINGGATTGAGGGGVGTGGGVEAVLPGYGVTVSGSATVPVVAANKAELGEWFADRDITYQSLEFLDARIDALQSVFIYAGAYNASLRQISSVSADIEDQFPLPPPDGYAVTASLLQVPAAEWNKRHFLIVSEEGQIPADDDGIVAIPGSVATFMRVGDWIISDGAKWAHLTYSARALLASSIVYEGPNAVTHDTVQEALDHLFGEVNNRVKRTGDTMSGPLILSGAPTVGAYAANKTYVDTNIHETLRYNKSHGYTGGDLNALTVSGFYDGSGMGNAPNANWWYIHHQQHSNNPTAWAVQDAYYFYDVNLRYQRIKQNGAWGGWTRGYADSAGNADTVDGYHAHQFAASSHGHNPTQVGVWAGRIGPYNVAANSESGPIWVGKAGDEIAFANLQHSSAYLILAMYDYGGTAYHLKIRNTTQSTNHTNIYIHLLHVRQA